MKARVKATGEIVEVAEYSTIYAENYDTCFYPDELEFLDTSDDYWTRLEHQYAGMAMQGMLSGKWVELMYLVVNNDGEYRNLLTDKAQELAHALVEKYKEKEEKND